ncbi:MAG: patatin-like phospholipase family protein, partial [Pseudomonadota bacterium]
MTRPALLLKAGPAALDHIRANGLDAASIRTFAGASGGAKWLVLYGLDCAIAESLLPRLTAPVNLVGSSIGTWRYACYAQNDPVAALKRFRDAYVEQRYSERPDRDEITRVSRDLLAQVLGANGAGEIVAHPLFRSHVIAVRCRGLTASESRLALGSGLALAAAANLASRRTLGWQFQRVLFHDRRSEASLLQPHGFPLLRVELTHANVADAIVASSSIPLVLDGVAAIDGAPPGVYRDGGLIDYHLDLPLSADGGITVYPHFYERLIPGWFDKRLTWRRPAPEHLSRVLLLAPSPEFVAGLPGGKIPDRTDFYT